MMNKIFFVFVLLCVTVEASFRYENRTLTCTSNGIDQCTLTAPDTRIKDLDLEIECRREPVDPENPKNKKLRLACPIRCPKDYEVHVLNKIPSSNRKCTKYYTYGKYQGENEWYIWMLEPCISTISTHCRVPEDV
ncbi:unnamed protein product [Caenorhabditis brenneri]